MIYPTPLIEKEFQSKGRAVQSCAIKIHDADFDTHGCDLTARLARVGAVGGGWLCIFRTKRRGSEGKRYEGGGGCAKPLRGQAPVTPNSLILRSLAISTHYKLEEV